MSWTDRQDDERERRDAQAQRPHHKPWSQWHPGDPSDIENQPSREDLRGLEPYASTEPDWPPRKEAAAGDEDRARDARRQREERDGDVGAPFARGQEFGLETDGPPEAGGSPGDYGRQSTSSSSSTYSGRTADRPRTAGFGDGSAAWGSGWPGRQVTRDEEASRGSWGVLGRRGREAQRRPGPFSGRGPKGYRRSDVRIREDLSDRLAADPDIDASEIQVAVSDGEVTLTGSIDSRRARWRMEELAESIPGVRDVQNQVRVRRGLSGSMG